MGLVIYEFSSGEGLLRWTGQHPGEMDLLFLDIEMQALNGMDTARKIRETDKQLVIVFVTGYRDYVFDGYSVGALDYLLKPVREEQLEKVLKRALGALALTAPETFTVNNTRGMYRVPYGDILYFYSDKRQVVLVTAKGEYPFYDKLDAVADAVGSGFVRIHQRYLVRAAAVDRIEGAVVRVGEASLPVSRACRAGAMAALAQNMLDRRLP